MYKKELKEFYDSINNLHKEFTNVKIALHTLDKLGFNVENLYKKLDCVGIELYKFNNDSKDFINDKLKG